MSKCVTEEIESSEELRIEELRIGSLVFDSKTCNVDRVDAVHIGRVLTDDHQIGYREIKPVGIPLNEERLIGFGFEISSMGAIKKRIIGDEVAKFKLTYSGSDWWLEKIYGSCFGYRPIKYVHQLQNIYYELTGEHL